MSLSSIKQALEAAVIEFKNNEELQAIDETTVRQVIILRILATLGWNTYSISEVQPEYGIETRRVDYCLHYSHGKKLFIEAKRPSEKLDGHQEQLLDYAFRENVDIAILTNGFTWWFYLPKAGGDWNQRKFYAIDILEQEPKDIINRFITFLMKENIDSGKALEEAEKLHKSHERNRTIAEKMPEAWKLIINEPNELLVDLIAETTEEICGLKPSSQRVAEFVRVALNNNNATKIQPLTKKVPSGDRSSNSHEKRTVAPMTPRPTAFSFDGQNYPVRYWKDVLTTFCNMIGKKHSGSISQVLNHASFSRDASSLRHPCEILNTGIYVKTHLSTEGVKYHVSLLLKMFGYPEDAVKYEF